MTVVIAVIVIVVLVLMLVFMLMPMPMPMLMLIVTVVACASQVDPMRVGDEEKPVWRAKPDLSRFNAPAKLISMPIVNPQAHRAHVHHAHAPPPLKGTASYRRTAEL
eukprot:5747850-Pleurochrysis_carterae.AAC.1